MYLATCSRRVQARTLLTGKRLRSYCGLPQLMKMTPYRMSRSKTLLGAIEGQGDLLRSELGIEIAELDANGSKFFKALYNNSPRVIRRAK